MAGFHNIRSGIGAAALFAGLLPFANTASAAVEISTKPTANMTCSGGVCAPTAKKAVLNVNDLAGMLAAGDVKVTSGESLAKDIDVDASLSWTSAHHLTLDSWRSIAFNRPVIVAGTAALTITTNDGGSGGDFRFFEKGRVEFWDLGSALTINGQSYVLVKSIKELSSDIRHADHTGHYALAKNINAKGKTYTGPPVTSSFEGTFEGLGNTISNLTISSFEFGQVGLFSQLIDFAATVRDVGLVAVNVSGGNADTGALVGVNNAGKILNCYATGRVSGAGQASVGGLVGRSETSLLENSFADMAVSTTGNGSVGGLVGKVDGFRDDFGIIQDSYALGAVSGGDGAFVGGVVGNSFGGVVSNSYATGSVSGGANAFVGGLVGANVDNPDQQSVPQIMASYSTGAVSGGSGATVGGLVGSDVADAKNTNSYWNMDTSGIGNSAQGAGNIQNDPGITGLSDAQLKSGLPMGFDKKVWKEKATLGNGYPYLIDNAPSK
jgi:hypothetical protein